MSSLEALGRHVREVDPMAGSALVGWNSDAKTLSSPHFTTLTLPGQSQRGYWCCASRSSIP